MNTEELRKVAEAATPGDWLVGDDDRCTQIYTPESDKRDVWINGAFLQGCYVVSGCGCCGSPEISDADAAHIAAFNPKTAIALLDRIAALEAENVELRKDAERYRWLRDVSVPPHNFYLSVPDEFADVKYSKDEVDAAIDAALKETP